MITQEFKITGKRAKLISGDVIEVQDIRISLI